MNHSFYFRCQVCKNWEKLIPYSEIFIKTWVVSGTDAKKDSLGKHIQAGQHKNSEELQRKIDLGAISFNILLPRKRQLRVRWE